LQADYGRILKAHEYKHEGKKCSLTETDEYVKL
jgi:hypothetical protein